MKLDLHTHSTESDGTTTPTELVTLAAAQGIGLLALTDHDTINGIDEAAGQADRAGIRFLAGLELQISYTGGEFHLLGLGLQTNLDRLQRELNLLADNRRKRNLQILEKIQAVGIPLTYAEVAAEVGGQIMGRPHFARALLRRGFVQSISEAFRLYLGDGRSCYVAKKNPELEEGIALIKDSGGITVVAHPATLGLTPRKLKEFLLKCKKKGLDGIEVYHPDQSLKLCADLERFAQYNKFLITGGSDYHGTNRREHKLGYYTQDLPIPEGVARFFGA